MLFGDLNNGKLFTGDLGFKDKQGFYFIVGRKKRFLKIIGHRINLDELEIQLRVYLKYKKIYCTGDDNELIVLTDKKEISNNILNCLHKEFKINKNLVKLKTTIALNGDANIVGTTRLQTPYPEIAM